MKLYGLDFEVWFQYGELSRTKVAAFWLYNDARTYIERKESKELFSLVDKLMDRVETVKDWEKED